MMERIRSIIGAKLWIRILVCLAIVISANFFNIFTEPLTRLLTASVFITSCSFFLALYAPRLFSQFQLLSTHKKAVETPIPGDIAELANRMGINIRKLRVKEGWCNAYAVGHSLVLGSDLMHSFTPEQRCAVVAHELGHIKEKHDLISYLAINAFIAYAFFNWLKLPILMLFAATLAYSVVIVTLVNWYLEIRADKIAAKFTAKENIKSALLNIAAINDRSINESSETHPSIARRIKRIEHS
jgi:Zn-dependent protease with chaperone function